jgi:hypothetical protein
MEVIINIFCICVDGTIYIIITNTINIVARFDFLFLLVPQLRLYPDPGSEINTLAAMCDTQTERMQVCAAGFYKRAVRVVDVYPMSFFCVHVNGTSLFGKSFLTGQQIYKKKFFFFRSYIYLGVI